MAGPAIVPTGRESPFGLDEIIVTKTDLAGRITYANEVFLRVSRYGLPQVVGQPHSIIRHPDMPRCVFKLLWDALAAREEVFAYVLNLASNGDHYWVFAHITPSFDAAGNVVGYHSNRRKPDPGQVAKVQPLYQDLIGEERHPSSRKEGMLKAYDRLLARLASEGVSYDQFVLAL